MMMIFHDDVFDSEVFHDDYNLDGIGDYDKKIQVGTDSEGEIDEIFFIWPTTLVTNIPFGKVQKSGTSNLNIVFTNWLFICCRYTRLTVRVHFIV